MSPKDKALRLCQDFAMTTFGEEFNGGTTLPLEIAKKCALIAVEEILEAIYSIIGKEKHFWRDGERDSIDYWESVKLEITSL